MVHEMDLVKSKNIKTLNHFLDITVWTLQPPDAERLQYAPMDFTITSATTTTMIATVAFKLQETNL